MEGRSLLLTSSAACSCSFTPSPIPQQLLPLKFPRLKFLVLCSSSTSSAPAPAPALVIEDQQQQQQQQQQHVESGIPDPKIDKSGRFSSPRAARELALSVIYAACLEGSDPIRLFDKRLNVRWETGYEFDRESLVQYNPMSFGGPPVVTNTVAEADQLLLLDQNQSLIEAEVLSAPPKLVYSKLVLRFARKLLAAVVEKWDNHVLVIDKVAPSTWKNDPAGRILELSILHLAMSEIAVLETRHPIVINEAVDLAKRFCDGAAPRIINGCLRSFIKQVNAPSDAAERSR